MQDDGLAVPDDRVSGIGAALIANHEIGPRGEDVDDLPLSLVPPLGPDHHQAPTLGTEHDCPLS